MNKADFIVGGLCGLVIACQFGCIIVALHMAYTKEDALLKHFKNSSVSAPMKHSGLMGKLKFIGGISTLVTFPRIHLKHGRVSAEDLSNCPAPLKRKLVILQWSLIGLFGVLALLVAIEKSGLFK